MKIALQPAGVAQPFLLEVHAGEDLLSQEILRNHVWEPYETELVVANLEPGQTFVDVGANVGYYTLLASMLVGPSGSVVAVEPEPTNFVLLERNSRAHPMANITLFNAGLADRDQELTLFLSPDNLGDHRLFDDGARAHTRIRVRRGDELLADAAPRIDFLKIDTQGAEQFVIEGLEQLIHANRTWIRMIVEYWPYGLQQNGTSARALIESLARFDLTFNVIDHLGYRLLPSDPAALIHMAEEGDLPPESEGFINLFLTPGQVFKPATS